VAFSLHTANPGTQVFMRPVFSISALLFCLLSVQLMLIGLVADGVLRRIAQHGRALVPSRALLVLGSREPGERRSTATGIAAAGR
jgi:hypothetical protein